MSMMVGSKVNRQEIKFRQKIGETVHDLSGRQINW